MAYLYQITSALDPLKIKELAAAARGAAVNSHAPYSHFHVGAAVLDDRGRVFCGCNVENASFGLTICAEHNAVGAAVCGGAKKLLAVAVYSSGEVPAMPCGACRQVLAEFGLGMEVHLLNDEGSDTVYSLKDLLPAAFTFESGGK